MFPAPEEPCRRPSDHDWDAPESECCAAQLREDGLCAACGDHPGDPMVTCLHCAAETHQSVVRYQH